MTANVLDAIIPALEAYYLSDYEYIAKCPLCSTNYVSLGIVKSLDWLTLCCNKCSYDSLVRYIARKYDPIIQWNSDTSFKYWYADSDANLSIYKRAILVDRANAAAALVSYGFAVNFNFNVVSFSDANGVDLVSLNRHSEIYLWPTNNKTHLKTARELSAELPLTLMDVRALPVDSDPAYFTWYECLRLLNFHVLLNSLSH